MPWICPSCQTVDKHGSTRCACGRELVETQPVGIDAGAAKASLTASPGPSPFAAGSVFTRTEATGELISPALYNLTIGIVLLWGFAVNWVILKLIPAEAVMAVNIWVFLIGYFVSCICGVILFESSTNAYVSFAGYNLVAVPFGLVVNMVVSEYDPTLVLEAVKITGTVTVIMMSLGYLFPALFQKIYGPLTGALVTTISVELFQIFIFGIHSGIIDWVVAIIFCGYIGYDWGRACSIPKTVDNAVDSAAAIYMDVINLFVRILQILGSKDDE